MYSLPESEHDQFNLTSLHKLLQTKNYRKSIGAISFKKMDITRANTTLYLTSRRTSLAKTVKKVTLPSKAKEEVFRATCKDAGTKNYLFGEYLSDPSVLNDYKMMSHIGKGCFSTVTLAIHKETGRNYAMKTY